jgi:hypothetical protein
MGQKAKCSKRVSVVDALVVKRAGVLPQKWRQDFGMTQPAFMARKMDSLRSITWHFANNALRGDQSNEETEASRINVRTLSGGVFLQRNAAKYRVLQVRASLGTQ